MKKPLLLIFLILIIDQVIKIYVKTHFVVGEEYRIAPWFIINFQENNGIAFSMFSGQGSKIFLSLFRIVAVFCIGWYLRNLVRNQAHKGLIMSIALIFAGALGNIIDSAFYGLIFSDSNYEVAKLFPHGGGYAGFLHGKVVDMFFFPLIEGRFPAWLPIWGSQDFIFFREIFNFSDSAISVGIFLIIIFQRKFYPRKAEIIATQKETGESTQSI